MISFTEAVMTFYITLLLPLASYSLGRYNHSLKHLNDWDTWVAQLLKRLPSAQVTIPGWWNQAPGQAPSSVSSLFLSLPPQLPLLVLSHSFSNK